MAVSVLVLHDEAAAKADARAHGQDPAGLSPSVEDPPPTLQQLVERLGEVAEVSVKQEGDGTVVAVEKLGQRYVVTPEGDVRGDR